jgi:uncharacterized membrane protein YedE/YeeE
VGARVAGAVIGLVFGITLCWSGMSNPDVIRKALLFEDSYLFLMFASAVAVAMAGQELLRRRRGEALVRERPHRRHVVGSLLFGIGWGVADACPGPIATQVGQGIVWAAFTFAGAVAGVYLFQRRGAAETEPPADVTAQAGARAGLAEPLSAT